MIVVNGTKAAQLLAFLERCAHLDADVQSSVERGFFTVTIPPPVDSYSTLLYVL